MAIKEPLGVRYTKTRVNYQLFPEEFFASSDVSIYFNDVWVDDISGFQFELTEMVKPVYGYASKTWDYIMRGKRMIRGTFRIAFREAGYLFTIFDHIGQLVGRDGKNVAPAIAYALQGQQPPKWYGQAKQRIEDILRYWHEEKDLPITGVTETLIPPWPENVLKRGMTGNSVRILQQWLTYEGYYNGPINGIFDEATENAVKTKQRRRGEPQDGIVGAAIKRDYSKKEYKSATTPAALAKDANGWAEPRMVQYEMEIWGRPFVQGAEDVRKHESFFWRGRTTDVNGLHTQGLMQKGIDIYINYGPLPEFVQAKMQKITEEVASFNTTVRAIRNVQLTNLGQIIDSRTGEPIEEVYEFIAQDLD
jgi:hypothetical protein